MAQTPADVDDGVIFGGPPLMAAQQGSPRSLSCLQGEGRLPGWKDGLGRSFAHGSTPSRLEERRKGAKRSGVGNPGAMTSSCSADEAPGHLV